jgi:predicted SAM-dependent methyltransferase
VSDVDKWYRHYWARHQAREVMYRTLRARCLSSEDCPQLNEIEQVMFDRTRHAQRLLDFGAGDNRLKRKFQAGGFQGRYETLDLSTEEKHDYTSLSQVSGQFDAILCLEVVEHISLNDYVDLMDEFDKLILPGGTLIVSTPNPHCVVPMWAGDPGHVQQYPMADLGADFVIRGYQVEAFRVRYGRWPKGVSPRLRFFSMRVLCYLLSVDYANGLVMIGKKKLPQNGEKPQP